jgi:hypothetical protein
MKLVDQKADFERKAEEIWHFVEDTKVSTIESPSALSAKRLIHTTVNSFIQCDITLKAHETVLRGGRASELLSHLYD